MKNYEWKDWRDLFAFILLCFVLAGAVVAIIDAISILANIDVNEPPGLVCIKEVEYFSDTLTPVFDVNSLNPTTCK